MKMRALLLVLATGVAAAEVKLPHVFSDHGVIQRGQPVRVWGAAGYGERVTVKFHEQTIEAAADANGMWEAWLRPEVAGGPYTLTVTGSETKNPVVRTDILVGDVWIASGQSNMEMPLRGFGPDTPVKDSAKEIAAANWPKMRLLLQTRRTAQVPMSDTDDVWQVCTPETARNFSAVAYFFGRTIMQEENVPIGLVDTTWGGTPAQAWISQDGIAWAGLTSVAVDDGRIQRLAGTTAAVKENQKAQDAALKADGKAVPKHGRILGDSYGAWPASGLFNAMVAPYVPYTIRGWIWYQGETDHEGVKAAAYSRVFPALIQDWRKQWGEGPLPFLYVQISIRTTEGEGWAQVRDAQRRTLELVNTGMAVTLDIGLAENVHPPDKQTVGARLAANAEALAYGKSVEHVSPLYERMSVEGSSARAWFAHGEGLTTKDATIGDFEVEDAGGKWYPATAKIEMVNGRGTVLCSSDKVKQPAGVRYAWNSVARTYLYNAAGFPMSTFTSESDVEFAASSYGR